MFVEKELKCGSSLRRRMSQCRLPDTGNMIGRVEASAQCCYTCLKSTRSKLCFTTSQVNS